MQISEIAPGLRKSAGRLQGTLLILKRDTDKIVEIVFVTCQRVDRLF